MRGTIATLAGVVAATGDTVATLTGTVDNGTSPATLEGTVSRGLVDSCEAPCIRTGFKVRLDGTWLPDADLVSFTLRELADSPVVFLDIVLAGEAYAILQTLATWTITTVELWTVNGPPGKERETLRFAGYVRPGGAREESGDGGQGCTVTVGCTNAIGRHGEFELCHEIEPLAGLTRGAIMTELCADAGLTAVDFPDGAVYTKGIQAKNTKLLAFLLAFVEPEGWLLREMPRAFADGGPILGIWQPGALHPPLSPDETWDLSRTPIDVAPPDPPPSRYVVRGYGAVFVDELGQTTRVNVTEIEALYAPKVAVQQQLADGSVISTGFTPATATLRLIQRVTDTLVSRGDKPITQETVDEGWYNPKASHQETNGGGGYDYRAVYIDEAGEYVLHWQERFMERSRRQIAYSYDVDGNATGQIARDFRWFLRTQGIGTVGSGSITVVGAQVFGDGNSYQESAEEYGQAEEHVAVRVFNDTTGAEDSVTLSSYGYRAPRAAIGPGVFGGHYVRSDGYGQSELTANWREYARLVTRQVIVDGTLAATIEEKYKLDTYRMLEGVGDYEWGDFSSAYVEETLLLSDVKRVGYKAISSNTFIRTTERPGEQPAEEIVSGRIPQPRYKTSPWTYLAQEPIELVVDDATAEALFGFRREVVQNDHIQSLEEAARVIESRRRRALALRVSVARHESFLPLGATVFVSAPDHSLAHRGWISEATVTRSRPGASQTGSYQLEVAW